MGAKKVHFMTLCKLEAREKKTHRDKEEYHLIMLSNPIEDALLDKSRVSCCSSNARGVKIYIKMYEEEFYSAYIAARLTRISRPLRGEGKNSSESTELPCLLSP